MLRVESSVLGVIPATFANFLHSSRYWAVLGALSKLLRCRNGMRLTANLALMLCVAMLLSHGKAALARETPILDCPMRDAPFSVDSPLLDILLSPRATAVLKDQVPGLVENLPPFISNTQVPSFAAIFSLRPLLKRADFPRGLINTLDRKLSQLEVTEADQRARCARYDDEVPQLDHLDASTKLLVFHKINGFDHGPSVEAATKAISALAEQMGWGVVSTDKGGAINPETLATYDAVIWNNVSGDVLTLSQREALRDYVSQGGGFLAMHGAGGDPVNFWDWYVEELIGAHFIGHPDDPQFQRASVEIEGSLNNIGLELRPGWVMTDEWYSFRESPRSSGADVVATLDESSYVPEAEGGRDLRMGEDHPIVWTRCVGQGRSFYSAIGHRPEVYNIPEYLLLLRDALVWVVGEEDDACHGIRR